MSTRSPEPSPPSPPGVPTAVRPRRLVAAGLGVVAFGVLLGYLLTSTLRPRMGDEDVITGGVVSPSGQLELNPAAPGRPGNPAGGAAAAGPPEGARAPTDQDLAVLAKRAEREPADVEAQLSLVRAALDADRADLAVAGIDRVLERVPKHPAALTYLGLLTAAQGSVDTGLELIEQALEAAPGEPFALWAKGGILFEHGRDYSGAAAAWEAMVASAKVDPGTRATVREWIAEARWREEHAREMAGRERPGGVPGSPTGAGSPR